MAHSSHDQQKLPRVGVAGLGIIGSQVARHLTVAGFAVATWNRTPKPGCVVSPAELAQECEVIQLLVADPQAVFEVIAAMGEALGERHLVLCSATIGKAATLEAQQLVTARGARFLDAPFTGSKAAAQAGQLLYYVSGEPEVIREAEPVLRASGGKGIVEIGPRAGDAAVIKVVTNVLNAVTVEALAEMLALLKATGVAQEALGAALSAGHAVRSGLSDMKLPTMVEGDYGTHFALKHMLKDVRFGDDLAKEAGLHLPAMLSSLKAMEEGVERGWADDDFSTLRRLYP